MSSDLCRCMFVKGFDIRNFDNIKYKSVISYKAIQRVAKFIFTQWQPEILQILYWQRGCRDEGSVHSDGGGTVSRCF